MTINIAIKINTVPFEMASILIVSYTQMALSFRALTRSMFNCVVACDLFNFVLPLSVLISTAFVQFQPSTVEFRAVC